RLPQVAVGEVAVARGDGRAGRAGQGVEPRKELRGVLGADRRHGRGALPSRQRVEAALDAGAPLRPRTRLVVEAPLEIDAAQGRTEERLGRRFPLAAPIATAAQTQPRVLEGALDALALAGSAPRKELLRRTRRRQALHGTGLLELGQDPAGQG